MYYWTSKILFGQVYYGQLLVPGQVENFTISTPLDKGLKCHVICRTVTVV